MLPPLTIGLLGEFGNSSGVPAQAKTGGGGRQIGTPSTYSFVKCAKEELRVENLRGAMLGKDEDAVLRPSMINPAAAVVITPSSLCRLRTS